MINDVTKIERVKHFWARVDKSGGEDACWPWMGALNAVSGYGHLSWKGKHTYAHRVAWALANDEEVTTPGRCKTCAQVNHTCEARPDHTNACCNPRHLRKGTPAENMRDRDMNGHNGARGRAGIRKEFCVHGHNRLVDPYVWVSAAGKEVHHCRGCISARWVKKRDK